MIITKILVFIVRRKKEMKIMDSQDNIDVRQNHEKIKKFKFFFSCRKLNSIKNEL